jgi:dynein light chain LC8-type
MAEGEAGAVSEYKHIFGVRVHNPIDMDETMLRHAIETSKRHLAGVGDWQKDGDEVVGKIKEEFDAEYGPHWHVIIGKHFGSKVTHDARMFAFFYIEVR